MRLFFAILICRFLRFCLHLTGRGGTALPGRAALRLCPDMLARLSRGITIVAVTGTNGKTTTCRMIERMLADAGRAYFANRSGSNLERGIAAELAANATLTGRPKKAFAVIECDEAAFRTVCGKLSPAAVVVTNLFRDQLDRYGEVTHTLANIREGLESAPDAVICANADCPLCASLGSLPNPKRFFGMDVPLDEGAEVSDAPRCLNCGGLYEYDWHTFAHLGAWRCPDCGARRPEPAVSVTGIDALEANSSRAELTADGVSYPVTVSLPGSYDLYNAAAALAAATAVGIPVESACLSLARVQSGFGRQESFDLSGVPVTVILVKNPAGCERAIEYVASIPGEKLCCLCLNDKLADGTDVSWIWDAAFEGLVAEGTRLAVSGTRARDMRLRLKYAGADETAVTLLSSDAELLALAERSRLPCYILPTYTAMLPLRHELCVKTGRKEFWQ